MLRSGCLLVFINSLQGRAEICNSPTRTFTTKVDLFAGELGGYVFEECGDTVNPTIAMEIGETYTFVQKDRTNFYHRTSYCPPCQPNSSHFTLTALGFAYSPYGDEQFKVELSPSISKSTNTACAETLSCPAPMYFRNDKYLGKYSNIPEVINLTTGEDNHGLDQFESSFFRTAPEWTKLGTFSVKMRFNDVDFDADLFYFCHVHEFMVGRIKLTKNGSPVSPLDNPALGFYPDDVSEFDKQCGTFGLDKYQLPNRLCPDRFVCGVSDNMSEELQLYARCNDAMNCHMLSGMTTGVSAKSPEALFAHQMIAHHQNAVNMAKSLLKLGSLDCEDLSDVDNSDCLLEGMLYEMIAGQNYQIQGMYEFLHKRGMREEDNCEVEIETVVSELKASSALARGSSCGSSHVHVVGSIVIWLLWLAN